MEFKGLWWLRSFLPVPSREKRSQTLKINPAHAHANSRNDFPRDRAGFFAQFRAGNFFATVAPHENNIVPYLNVIEFAHIDHHQVHCHPTEKRAPLSANQDGGPTIGEMPRITIGVAGG